MFNNSTAVHRLTSNTAFHSGENRLVYVNNKPEVVDNEKNIDFRTLRALMFALLVTCAGVSGYRSCEKSGPEPEPVADKTPSTDMCLPAILPLEEYVKYTENGKAENTPEVKADWERETQLIINPIEPIKEEDIVDIGSVFPLFKEKGEKAVNELKKKYVRFPRMGNGTLKMENAINVMDVYKKDNVDLVNEVAVDTGLIGSDRLHVWLPKHFWEKLVEAAAEKNIAKEKIQVSTGIRNHVQQAVMFVRSVYKTCDNKYPSQADEKCMKDVDNQIAVKPEKSGYTHMFSADVDNWEAFKKPLLDRNFAVGCNGFNGESDARHTTWNMTQEKATLSCKLFQGVKKVKTKVKNSYQKINKAVRNYLNDRNKKKHKKRR